MSNESDVSNTMYDILRAMGKDALVRNHRYLH